MIIAKNDEVKRSKIWRWVTFTSSALIVIFVVYLLMKLFTTNPLIGTWESEDETFTLEFVKGGTVDVHVSDIEENGEADVRMSYEIDRSDKILSIEQIESQIDEAMESADGKYTREDLENVLDDIATSFDYSVDRDQMTLTEREYGEQMTFVRK